MFTDSEYNVPVTHKELEYEMIVVNVKNELYIVSLDVPLITHLTFNETIKFILCSRSGRSQPEHVSEAMS